MPESAVPLADLGRFVEDELGEALCFEFNAANLKRWSTVSRFFDGGGLLCAAYGSLSSPFGVTFRLYTGAAFRVGLGSREVGTESFGIVSCVGPIEKSPWCLGSADSPDILVGLVEAGRESLKAVIDGDEAPPEICGVIASISSSLLSGAPFTTPPTAS